MEAYVLDSLLRRVEVLDTFESFIWTERFSSIGDFDMVVHSNRTNRSLLTAGVRLACNRSMRVMTIETVEDVVDSDGQNMLSIKGRSLESTLEDRIAKDTMNNLVADPAWSLYGKPGDIVRQMFRDICVLGQLDPQDVIPFITAGTIMPNDTVLEPQTPITWIQEPVQLYSAIKTLCDLYDLGFRLVRNYDMSQLYFDVYAGSDRTSRQTTLPPVIFSLAFDNLQDTKELTTIEKSKNVAYVFSDEGSAIVYPEGVDPDLEGFDRRVLLVSTSLDDTVTDIPAALRQKGLEELSKHRSFSGIDGELAYNSGYVYGVHYQLGDFVELRNIDGVISYKRVTEQIFVHDNEGERAYPTLASNLFISSNTWLSQPENRVWSDYGATEYWADQ